MSQTMKQYVVKAPCGVENEFEDKDKANEQKDAHAALCPSCEKGEVELIDNTDGETEESQSDQSESESESDAKEVQEARRGEQMDVRDSEPEIVKGVADDPSEVKNLPDEFEPADMGVETDPLEILPDYMIDHVQEEPTLNKRGLSVLAFHYGVTIEDREILVSPHESEWEYAIVETTVTNEEGNTFVGTGTAHVDRGDDKGVLLEMAETRSYKRAVSFATGTGIVSYQEMTNELE